MVRKLKMLGLLSLAVLCLSSCGNTNSGGCDPDDTFCDPDDETNLTVIELEDDMNTNYTFDKTITNKDASTNYEIFVRSFYDSDGDGIGDFNGIASKLDYLEDLGIKNLWLMPINPSHSYHGYDISDYYDVNHDYGTLEDFKNLVKKAKEHNIGIIIDFVINHCSDENQMFIDSYNDYVNNNTSADSKADWFNWSTSSKSGYNKYKNSNYYYESRFSSTMPDFNLNNEKVRDEIDKITKYWIDLGVIGFRLDAVLYYYYNDNSDNIAFLNWFKSVCLKYNKDCYIVGECWTGQETISEYYNSGIDSFFSFSTSLAGATNGSIVSCAKGIVSANLFGDYIESQESKMKEINPNAVSSYFLSNHDMDRSSNNLTGFFAKAAASLTYLLPGTPYIYYGEEIGLLGVRKTSPDDGTDVMRRLPMIWNLKDKTGECAFPEKNRQDLSKYSQVSDGVDDLLNENYSLLNHYKKVINIRNKYSFIRDGIFTNLTKNIMAQNSHVLMYKIQNGDDCIIIVHNFNTVNVKVNIGNVSSKILDSINVVKKVPTLDSDGTLKIGKYSSVILNCN